MAVTFGSRQTYTTPGGGQQALYDFSCALDATHFVVAWRDANDSDYGKCVIGTISGSSVTYGSVVTFNAADTRNPKIAKIDSAHFVIVFRDSGDSGKGKAMIATVASGDVITFGAEYTFAAGTANNPAVALLDSTHIVVTYDDLTNTDGSAIVGTISATDVISFGTRVAFVTTSINSSDVAVLDSTHFVVVFKGGSNEYVKSIIGVVSSGTTITFGTAVSVLADNSNSSGVAAIDSTHFLVGYSDNTAGLASGNVGTVSSGDSISIGTKYSAASHINSEIQVRLLSSTTFFFAGVVSGTISVITGTIAGSVLSYDAAVIADSSADNNYTGADMLSATSMVVTYGNTTSSPIGTARIGSLANAYTTTLTEVVKIVPTMLRTAGKLQSAAIIVASNMLKDIGKLQSQTIIIASNIAKVVGRIISSSIIVSAQLTNVLASLRTLVEVIIVNSNAVKAVVKQAFTEVIKVI